MNPMIYFIFTMRSPNHKFGTTGTLFSFVLIDLLPFQTDGPNTPKFEVKVGYVKTNNHYKINSCIYTGVGICYGLKGRGSTPGSGKIFVFSTVSRPVLGLHPASHQMGTEGSFPGSKTAGA
jgi:hypothetical protein